MQKFSSQMLFFVVPWLTPFGAFASELRLDTSSIEVRTFDEFVVQAVLATNAPINAIEGTLHFPYEKLELVGIRDGNSSINLWIEKPHISDRGVIQFSGLTPGGITGVNNLLFSMVFRPIETGTVPISITDVRALLNDGLGTVTPLSLRNVVLEIKEGDSNYSESYFNDTIPPEAFVPIIERDVSLNEGRYFLSFNTQDKDSGISHYQIREGRLGFWKNITSPHILKHQSFDKDIYIRAIDNAGNIREVMIPRTSSTDSWYVYLSLGILLLLCVMFCYKIYVTRFRL